MSLSHRLEDKSIHLREHPEDRFKVERVDNGRDSASSDSRLWRLSFGIVFGEADPPGRNAEDCREVERIVLNALTIDAALPLISAHSAISLLHRLEQKPIHVREDPEDCSTRIIHSVVQFSRA